MILINNIEFEEKRYPAGEQILEFSEEIMKTLENPFSLRVDVKWRYKNDSEFMTLFFVTKKIKDLIKNKDCQMCLEIPYLPYARMDRIKSTNQFFSLKYVAEFIDSLGYDLIQVYDIHSDVLSQHIKTPVMYSSYIDELFEEALEKHNLNGDDVVLVFPDKTAVKRYSHLKDKAYSYVTIEKTRDFYTGKITGFELMVPADKDLSNKTFVIVDDICSYGGTFIGAIDKINQYINNVKNFILIVAHLEESFFKGSLVNNPNLLDVFSSNSLDYIKPGEHNA